MVRFITATRFTYLDWAAAILGTMAVQRSGFWWGAAEWIGFGLLATLIKVLAEEARRRTP